MSNYISLFYMDIIAYPGLILMLVKLITVSKNDPSGPFQTVFFDLAETLICFYQLFMK